MIERVLRAHRSALRQSVIVTNEPEHFEGLGVPLIPDRLPAAGPVVGLHAGLRWALDLGAEGIICTPCDAPFPSGALFELLLGAAPGHQAVVPRSRGPLRCEPQFAWYSTSLTAVVTAYLESGRRSLHGLVTELSSVRYLSEDETALVGDPELLFLNVNSPADLEIARTMLTRYDRSEG